MELYMSNPHTKSYTNNTQSNAQTHQGFVDDPIAESYAKHGRYHQKEILLFRSNSYLSIRKVIKFI